MILEARRVLFLPLTLFASILAACSNPEMPAPADGQSVSIMAFNVENLFDNVDDPGRNDATFLALEDKQTDEHRALCAEIDVKRWRDQCLYWDWSDAMIERKLEVVAEAILQVDGGRGHSVSDADDVRPGRSRSGGTGRGEQAEAVPRDRSRGCDPQRTLACSCDTWRGACGASP